MQTTKEFLAAAKRRLKLPPERSDSALADALEVTKMAVSKWQSGKGQFGSKTALKVAELLELDPVYVLACVHAERARDPRERTKWERIAKSRAASVGALAALCFGALFLALPEPAHAGQFDSTVISRNGVDPSTPGHVLLIMRKAAAWARRLARIALQALAALGRTLSPTPGHAWSAA